MIKSYVSNKGEQVVIAKMADAHLLNSYAYHKKRMEATKQNSFMSEHDVEMLERVKSLKAEIDRRELV